MLHVLAAYGHRVQCPLLNHRSQQADPRSAALLRPSHLLRWPRKVGGAPAQGLLEHWSRTREWSRSPTLFHCDATRRRRALPRDLTPRPARARSAAAVQKEAKRVFHDSIYRFRDPITHPETLKPRQRRRAAPPCPATRSPSSSPDPARPAWRPGR